MYRVELTRQAAKAFDDLMNSQPKMGERVAQVLDRLAHDPEQGIRLRGKLGNCWKYRIGVYRIIYQIVHQRLIVTVLDIGHRKDVYR